MSWVGFSLQQKTGLSMDNTTTRLIEFIGGDQPLVIDREVSVDHLSLTISSSVLLKGIQTYDQNPIPLVISGVPFAPKYQTINARYNH